MEKEFSEILGVSGKNTPGVNSSQERLFKTSEVKWPRANDAEAFIFENLAKKLTPNSSGTIVLISERAACDSCRGVIKQFKKMFPNVNIIIRQGGD